MHTTKMNKSYMEPSLVGAIYSNKYVDLQGRLVTVLEEYSGEVYVSLSELKKSGFELFEAGTLPKPGGYLNSLTDLQINQFEMYLRMKATKYLSRTIKTVDLSISQDHIEDIIKEQKEYYRLGQNPNRTVSYNNKGNYSITTKVEPTVKLVSNNFERNGNKMNCNRENSNQNQQMQYQRSNNYRSPNTERNNTNSYRKSSHEDVVSPSNSRTSFTKNEERKPYQPRADYSNTKQQPRLNSSYSKPEPISDKPPCKPQNLMSLSPVPPPEKMQNNIQQKRVSNSDFGSSSSMVSSTPVPSPIMNNKPKEQVNASNKPNEHLNVTNEPKEQANTITRKCVVDTVSQGGMFECVSTVNDNTIIGYAVPLCYTNEFTMLSNITDECQIKLNFTPALGDMIGVFYDKEDTYVRGIVINIVNNNYTCSLIDFGVLITTTNIRPLLKKFIEIPEFACCITGSVEDIREIKKETNQFDIEITSPGNLTLIIQQTNKKYKVQAKLWDSFNAKVSTQKLSANIKPLQVFKVGAAKNHLKSGDTVIIASKVNNSLIVRTRHCDILLKEVTLAIQKHQGVAEALTATPVVAQLVLCPYSSENNGSLYRAEVLSVEGQFANVRYTDYGDSDRVPVSAFKAVNETLANFSNTYIAITLQEFGSQIFTTKQMTFLEDCCNLRKKFTVIGTDIPQVFDLLFPDKTSLSKKLIDLEKPPAPPVVAPVVIPTIASRPSSRSSTEEKKYNITDLPDCVLKTGLNEIFCIYNGDLSDGLVTVCPNTPAVMDNLAEIAEVIADDIAKDNKPYKPDLLELCVAKFEDDWCRGAVMGFEDEGFSVYFVDYGNANSVKFENVRKISKKLVSYPAGGANCILKDINEDGSSDIKEPMLSKFLTHLKENEIYEINVIQKVDDLYDITIPSVYKKLKEEGVL